MGPFCRASRKLKGGQKGGDQSIKESSSKRISSQNDCDQKKNVQMPVNTVENQLEESANYSSRAKCVIPDTKLQKEASEGGNKICRRANLQKECSQPFFSEVPHENCKGELEEYGTLGDRGCASVKQGNFELKDTRIKGKNEIGCAHTGRTQEVHCPIITADKPWKISEGKSDENVLGVSVCAVSEIRSANLKEDCKTDSILLDETSDICNSSLTLSLGLNRIKTRLCPPSDDSPDETIGGNPVHRKSVQSPRVKCGAERVNKSQFLQSGGQATLPSNNMARRDSYPSRKDQFKVSSEVIQHQGAALKSISSLGDTRSQDGCANNSSRMNEIKHTRLQRSMLSPQRSSLVRGSLEGAAVPLNSEVDACASFSSATGHVVDFVQLKSKESHRISQKSDNIMEKKVPSRFFDNDSSNTWIAEAENTQTRTSLFVNDSAISLSDSKQLDAIKETESIGFHALPNMSEGIKKKKGSKDIKSFSHELGPRCGKPYDYPRPHSDNDLEELLGALWARFNTAKEDVDSELAVFAADIVGILDKNGDSFPEWQEKMEDLLVLARRCVFMSSSDFRRECESIVRELVARRQDFGIGLLKQLHMRMLFILTQCTRLLQFQKEANPEEEGPLHKVQQCLKCVPSIERTWTSAATKKGDATRNIRKILPDLVERIGRAEATFSASKYTKKAEKVSENPEGIGQLQPLAVIDKLDSPVADCLTLLKKSDTLVDAIPNRTQSTDDWVSSCLKDNTVSLSKETWEHLEHRKHDCGDFQETLLQSSTSLKQAQSVSGGYWSVEQEHITEDLDSVICRICEEEVHTSHLEAHSFICALADTCDALGLSLDERLRMLADNLEKITELNTPKSSQQGPGESPDAFKFIKSHEGPDGTSPKLSDNLGKFTDARFEDMYSVDPVYTEEPRGLSIFSFKPYLGARSDQGVASSSAGSGTPRSTLTTPRNSQLDLLWAERSSFTELEDISQMYELSDIARCVANKSLAEQGASEYLVACMHDLHDVLERNRIAALTVDTFGRRIGDLLKEKYLLICESPDQRRVDVAINSFLDDGISTDDGINSVKSTPTHPTYKDQITIDDFELIKPISRGTFGRVFLARKRTTGDLFAIKVLRKIDMIRKNAVENILAERDILISVRNPFVVRFFYSFTCRENLYLVMEYLNGGDLYSLLRNMGCLEEHVARVYIAELVLALEYVHSLGVVHRDLKPDNMLIAHDGHIKLTDFGLSKVGLINSTDDFSGPASGTVFMDDNIYQSASGQSQQRERCKKRSAVGTPDYLAPEILLGTEHGYTADWWSTGIILFECLTGLPPFNAEHPQIIFDNILNRKLPWPHIPEEMSYEAWDLIDRLLIEDPNQRLGSKGASEVKAHQFFKDLNWDTLAMQKAAFVPKPESVDDTSYFTSRHREGHFHLVHDLAESSDCSSSSSSIDSLRARPEETADECREFAELESTPSMEYTFNHFSYKNLSQLASINYDLLSQTAKDPSRGHSRHPSAS